MLPTERREQAVWQQDETGRVRTPLEPVVLAATLALIPVLGSVRNFV